MGPIQLAATILLLQTATLASEQHNQQENSHNHQDQIQEKLHNVPFLLLMSGQEISVAQLPLIANGTVTSAYQLPGAIPLSSVEATDEEDDSNEEDASTSKKTSAEATSGVIADAREYEQMPSSPSSTSLGTFLNVTSASRIRRSQQQNKPKTTARQATAEEDKSRVQFSDFDVHMALGYAFVADSKGRVHRFRLSGFQREENSRASENDYTNRIDVAVVNDNFSPASRADQNVTRTINITRGDDEAAAEDSAASKADSSFDDNDANKVTQNDAVTHEQPGRHPSASGGSSGRKSTGGKLAGSGWQIGADPTSVQSSSTVNHHVSIQSLSGLIVDLKKEPLQQGGSFFKSVPRFTLINHRVNISTDDNTQSNSNDDLLIELNDFPHTAVAHGHHVVTSQPPPLLKHQHTDKDNAVEPRIIWSRMRLDQETAAGRRQRLASKGALSSDVERDTEHLEDKQQLMGEQYKQLERDSSESEEAQSTSGNVYDVASSSSWHERALSHSTEITVDWLNNLLFVLDKYRLFVVDFDGNNELLIIDDFNANNRPIDIKVDPLNGFLFWLQVGKFHNTIYKLDLRVLSMPAATESLIASNLRISQSQRLRSTNGSGGLSSELVALVSHHYAHPIITNLPKYARLFTIDHKHSRIYVPLAPVQATDQAGLGRNKTDDAEVFATSDETNVITHMNSTSTGPIALDGDSLNCSLSEAGSGQILAYNLDGTDVGPLRGPSENAHLSGLSDIQDITLDSGKGFLYWLTNGGRELFEEYKTDKDNTFYSAQHNLDGTRYMKLVHFDDGSNQPRNKGPRFNLTKLLDMISPYTSTNRWIRSDGLDEGSLASSLYGSHKSGSDLDSTRFSRNAPYIILGMTCLIVVIVYLIYTFVFQHTGLGSSHREGSVGGSFMSESQIGSESNTNGFIGTSTISRWIPKPPSRSLDVQSSINRNSTSGNDVNSCDVDSTNYNEANAIDEHYREMVNDEAVFDSSLNRLVNISEWPATMLDMSNKLYVPVEITQDEALSSINRISIDQLEIERRAHLGEGHFGTVLQGTITMSTKSLIRHKSTFSNQDNSAFACPVNQIRITVPSSNSSGHGSSSTSSDCADPSNGDYLTPKSQCNSDYGTGCAASSRPDSCSSYDNNTQSQEAAVKEVDGNSKIKVAIKKLRDNASVEEKRDFLQEAKLLANFDHPNIVQLIGICLDRGSTLIVMELMLGGDLIRYMQENTPDNLNNGDLLSICLDIVNGCCYLEELNYIHRDLAARNCLVSSRKREERVVKLADFGLARDIYKDSYYKKLNDSAMPLKWMAPECLTEQKFTTMSDVWSFGVVMWEVMSFCREKPYGNVEPFFMRDYLINGERLAKPENCSDDLYRLMNECWQLDPKRRPTFQECRATLIEISHLFCI